MLSRCSHNRHQTHESPAARSGETLGLQKGLAVVPGDVASVVAGAVPCLAGVQIVARTVSGVARIEAVAGAVSGLAGIHAVAVVVAAVIAAVPADVGI